jgi:DNA helicase-2/ATP-dependent DNA helicase PcrA
LSDASLFTLSSITDEQVRWACNVMGLPDDAFAGPDGNDPRQEAIKSLSTIDIEACPGSGKTTLLVAKLAILANGWTSRSQGICVLSHTNAARNEISQRLSFTTAGHALLRYPHFIGTIHSFVNEFLALPWLRSQGRPIRTIDDEITLGRRWWCLPFKTRVYLEKHKHKGPSSLEYERLNLTSSAMDEFPVGKDTHTNMWEAIQALSARDFPCSSSMRFRTVASSSQPFCIDSSWMAQRRSYGNAWAIRTK